MFTAVLFTIVKTWKQTKCPPTDKQRRCGIYTPLYIKEIYNKGLLYITETLLSTL